MRIMSWLGAVAYSGFAVWDVVSEAFPAFFCSNIHPKRVFLQTMYLSYVWKRIQSRKQNSAPESRCASLHSGRVIKMSRLTINRFLTLWSVHGLLGCCGADREIDCATFLSLDPQDTGRGQLRSARNCTQNPFVFSLWLSIGVLVSELFCLRLTKSTQIDLMKLPPVDTIWLISGNKS